MFLKTALVLTLVTLASSIDEPKKEPRRHRYRDPLTALDHHLSHSLAFHYLWPWSDLIKAAASLDAERNLEEPKIITDNDNFVIHLNARQFKPEELKVKVKNRYVTVEGKHIQTNKDNKKFVANHFVQQFVLPPGSKADEVTASFNERGILIISAPKHNLPAPPPEREVPISIPNTEKTEIIVEETTTKKEEQAVPVVTEKEKEIEIKPTEKQPTPQAEETKIETTVASIVEKSTESSTVAASTTHVNKIKKKELKNANPNVRENEVSKTVVDGNDLDYALIEPDE